MTPILPSERAGHPASLRVGTVVRRASWNKSLGCLNTTELRERDVKPVFLFIVELTQKPPYKAFSGRFLCLPGRPVSWPAFLGLALPADFIFCPRLAN